MTVKLYSDKDPSNPDAQIAIYGSVHCRKSKHGMYDTHYYPKVLFDMENHKIIETVHGREADEIEVSNIEKVFEVIANAL